MVAMRDVGATSCQVQDISSQSEMSQAPFWRQSDLGRPCKSWGLVGPAFRTATFDFIFVEGVPVNQILL